MSKWMAALVLSSLLLAFSTCFAQTGEVVVGMSQSTWSVGIRYHPPDTWWRPASDASPRHVFWEEHLSFYVDYVIDKGSDRPRGEDYSDILGPGGYPEDPFLGEYSYVDVGLRGGIELWTRKPVAVKNVESTRFDLGLILGVSWLRRQEWYQYYDELHILDPSGYYKCSKGDPSEWGFEGGLGLAISPVVVRYSYDTIVGNRFSLGLAFF